MLDKKNNLELFGDFKERVINAKARLSFVLFFLLFGYFLITLKIIDLTVNSNKKISNIILKEKQLIPGFRADIIDRNGDLLATSILEIDLAVYPKKIKKNQKKEYAEKISKILTDLKYEDILIKLNSNKNFVYLKRPITPKQFNEIDGIGSPHIVKIERYGRRYPHKEHASHILGAVTVDGQGIKGIEKTFDEILKNKDRKQSNIIQLSIDINLQKSLDEHLNFTINKHSADSGAGIILDVKTSEILAMNSLPQFNPNKIDKMNKKAEFNNATHGVFELGSVFKSLSGAIALDKNILTENTVYDAREPIKEGRFTINDYKPKKRKLKFSECILYSSNICFAQIGTDIGEKNMKEYFEKMKLTTKPEIEIPEVGEPILPDIWRKTDLMAMSYGHTIAVSPLQFVNAFSSIINGGKFKYSTLIKKENYVDDAATNVITEETSKRIRKLLREVVSNEEGSGKSANIKGYSIGGKTGTAIKNRDDRSGYKEENRTSFVGFFPSYDPRYIVFIMVDKPKKIKENFYYSTAGWVAAPTVKNIINEMIPKFRIEPEVIEKNNYLQASKY